MSLKVVLVAADGVEGEELGYKRGAITKVFETREEFLAKVKATYETVELLMGPGGRMESRFEVTDENGTHIETFTGKEEEWR